MAADLPPGTHSPALVGQWWPEPSLATREFAAQWDQACLQQQHYAQDLRNQRAVVAANNRGRTADDLAFRYHEGERFHLDLAEKYQAKARSFHTSADAVDLLRNQLTAIARDGNTQIDDILASNASPEDKAASIRLVHVACHAAASDASCIAVNMIAAGTRDVLRSEGVEPTGRTWLRDNDFERVVGPSDTGGREIRTRGTGPGPSAGGPVKTFADVDTDLAPRRSPMPAMLSAHTPHTVDEIGEDPVNPVVASSGDAPAPPLAQADASAPTPATLTAAPTDGAVAPIVPVMMGVSWSTPAAQEVSEPAALAEPLPAYGSDLRPPGGALAAPAPSAAPAAPTPSAPPAPSRGEPVVSPVERVPPPALSTTIGATTATAAAVSPRAAPPRRLRTLVAAVARQEPGLAWAAGLRDDGITTLLTTDLAAGWIPPHVRLPARVAVLQPGARRPACSAVDLLGTVVALAAHRPNADVAEPGPDAPALTGDRVARSAAPDVDELGPALVDAVRRRDGLPAIARALAAPAARGTGVLSSEAELLRAHVADVRRAVLSTYPHHDRAAAGDWMLLAAITALIDGHPYLANYHLAWFEFTKSEYR